MPIRIALLAALATACVAPVDGTTKDDIDIIEQPDAGIDDPIVLAPIRFVQPLTVTVSGAATGFVTSSPAGIACGASCSASFRTGTVVTLTATPSTGAMFAGWSGACAGTATCTVSMTAPQSVGATFVPITYALQLTSTGAGAGTIAMSPAGVACGPGCARYPYGTVVTLTAAPAAGSTFGGWTGDCVGAVTSCTLQMTQAHAAGAIFALAPMPVTIVTSGDGSGVIAVAPGGQTCASPGPCTIVVDYGAQLVLTAAPATGSLFAGWSGPCAGTAACAITVTQPITIGAELDRASYTLTVARSTQGTVVGGGIDCGPSTSTCTAQVPRGQTVELDFVGRYTSRDCAYFDLDATGCADFGGGCEVTGDHDASVSVRWYLECGLWY